MSGLWRGDVGERARRTPDVWYGGRARAPGRRCPQVVHTPWDRPPGPPKGLPPAGPSAAAAAGPTPQAREILALAVPAFGALVASSPFLLADSVIVGPARPRSSLAGLGVAGAILSSAVGIFVFLAYGTTALAFSGAAPAPGTNLGALSLGHRRPLAGRRHRDRFTCRRRLVRRLPAAGPGVRGWTEAVADAGGQLPAPGRCPGGPAMLVGAGATGVLRGLQDTRRPLLVAAVGRGRERGARRACSSDGPEFRDRSGPGAGYGR